MINKILSSKWTKAAVFLLSLLPLLVLLWFIYTVDLTANPLEYITHYTGDWTLRFFMITLAVTPLRVMLNRPAVTRFRRMLGLYTFFYGCLHLLTWVWFDRQFQVEGMWEDIAMRLYITVGMASWLTMLPLALTSNQRAIRKLGFKNWQSLHRLIYVGAAAGVVHYVWLVKSDIRKPLMYGGILFALLLFRLVIWIQKKKR
jgi:methionine sulfoxide reductase heme-binding subunit